jgi:CheY-like chemotaxis protein
MAHVRLIHWNGDEGRERQQQLRSRGHEVDYDDVEPPVLTRILRSGSPDVYVIDLTRLPSHGRQVAMWLRTTKATRHTPIVFLDGDPAKVAHLKTLLPDAFYTSMRGMDGAIRKALAAPKADPVVPPSSIYTGKPAAEKLGIKGGMAVCVMNAPAGFAESLAGLPPDARLTAQPSPRCDLFIAAVRSRRELHAGFSSLDRHVAKQTVWLVWPKKSSGVVTDLNGNVVRETGLAAGWVDFKICSIDDTWSGLAFKKRK